MQLTGATLFRLTRDAEVETPDDEEDTEQSLSEIVLERVKQRRFDPVVRIDFAPGADPSIRQMLRERFKLSEWDTYELRDEVDYTSLFEIAGLPIPERRIPGGLR
jgi:polyphosphate kinase